MKRLKSVLAVVAFWVGVVCTGHTQEAGVTWYAYDLPPISIMNGPDAGRGINNLVQQRLMQALPGYANQTRTANFRRITDAMRDGTEKALCIGFQKTQERLQWMLYSRAFTIALSPSIIVLKSRADEFRKRLGEDGMLSLDTLLGADNLRVGVATGRSYLDGINAVLGTYRNQPNVLSYDGVDISTGLLQMLAAERFDFTIMYPEEAQYLAHPLQGKLELVSYPIREAPPYASIHVVAPRNAWGEDMLAKINPVILQFRDSETFHREREQWMDAEARKRYRKLVRELKRTDALP